MKKITVTAAIAAVLAVSLALAATAGAATKLREFEGKVTSVDAAAKTFRLKDHERGTFTIEVTRKTRFEDLAGFSALEPGLKRVEAKVKRVDGAWIARKIELSGRDDDRADDDHGDDDDHDRGDDHGGDRHGGHGGHGGHGSDDD
jgi:hypothetical protein